MGKAYTEEQVNDFSVEEVDMLFNNYKVKLLSQMMKSSGKLIIRMYLLEDCAVLGMSNQDMLSEDLESDPFLHGRLRRTSNPTR